MAQPRAPKIDWLLEAWKLSTVLVNVPSRKLRSREFGVIPLDDDVETSLRELQGKLNAYLNFQTAKQFGVSRAKSLPQFGGANFRNAKDTVNLLRKAGVVFSDEAHTAVFVHVQIDFILQHCYLDRVEQVLLPATVASVAGKSVGLQTAVAAAHGRPRRQDLRAAKLSAMKNSGLSWKQLLDTLQGDDIVTEWDDKVIQWVDENGAYRKTATSTFRGWK